VHIDVYLVLDCIDTLYKYEYDMNKIEDEGEDYPVRSLFMYTNVYVV
jgi:hypothetical protein